MRSPTCSLQDLRNSTNTGSASGLLHLALAEVVTQQRGASTRLYNPTLFPTLPPTLSSLQLALHTQPRPIRQ